MKLLILSLSLLFTLNNAAEAATKVVTGDQARNLMEALASTGFPVNNMDADEWAGKTLTIETPTLVCRYSAADGPDEWMNEVECYTEADDGYRRNSLALAKALQPLADFEGAAGSRFLSVNSIKCSLQYDQREYQCTLDVHGRGNE